MTFKVGELYEVSLDTVPKFTGILIEKSGKNLVFKTISENSFNENIYCTKDNVKIYKKISKNKLFYYLNSKYKNLINQIFNSLKN